uniref:CCHC-type domain-containing protein n=1 Tax=Rhodnius prolixus TaxID=13249 RepID=T1IE94_RHOPR
MPSLFIVKMTSLIKRLNTPLTEEQNLQILEKNIKGDHLPHLAQATYSSVKELESVLCNLEIWNQRAARYRKPPAKGLLEPALGHRTKKPLPQVSTIRETGTQEVPERRTSAYRGPVCWNCGQTGHLARTCSSPKTQFCGRCGLQKVSTQGCTRCGPNQKK